VASLQDQLLQAGLVDKKKAKKLKQEKRKESKGQQKGHVPPDANKASAKRVLLEKAEHDRELNRQKQAKTVEKAVRAQIIQLIQMNRVDRQKGDIAYQFKDGNKIKKIYTTQRQHQELVNGRLAIAKLGENYELLPSPAAEKIMQRDLQVIVVLNLNDQGSVDENDPYADYQIPDDLMW
jgi:uncharacterized protein YaiL (DUF2058 family)